MNKKRTYAAPRSETVGIQPKGFLCESFQTPMGIEAFLISDTSYDDTFFE